MLVKRLMLSIALLILASPVSADHWELPDTFSVPSPNGMWRARIHPRDDNRTRPIASLYAVRRFLPDRRAWTHELPNFIAPAGAIVSNSGKYVATFDDWHEVGGARAVVILGQGGELVAQLSLQDLATPDEISQMFWSMSGCWWIGNARFLEDDEYLELNLQAPDPQSSDLELRFILVKRVLIRLNDGKIIESRPDA